MGRFDRDLGLGLMSGFAVAIGVSYAIHSRAPLWIGLAVGVAIFAFSVVRGSLSSRRQLEHGVQPGQLIARLTFSVSTKQAELDVQLPLRNSTQKTMRYRMVKFTVEVAGVCSPLIKAFEGMLLSESSGDFVRDPIEVPTMPVATIGQPVLLSVKWRLCYGPERKRRFRFRRMVGSTYVMSLPVTDSLELGREEGSQTVRYRDGFPDRPLTRKERKELRDAT
jgi:hypothetical protein